MPDIELLATIAQIALGIAGFAGIAVAFTREPGQLSRLEAYRLSLLFGTSLGALFLALSAWALLHSGLQPPGIWRFSSAALAVYTAGFIGRMARPTRRFFREARAIFDLSALVPLTLGHLANVVIQTLAALGAFGDHGQAIFVWGLIWLLIHAAQQFTRILFVRPGERELS